MKKIVISVLLSILLVGCTNNSGNDSAENGKQSMVNVKNSYIENVDRKTGQEISQRLVDLASSVPNVNDATAIVLGRYAIVGIDVNSKIDRSQVGVIKYSVAESLKKDPYGAKAVVVADADTNERLKEMQADIKKGRPIKGVMDELAEITGRLMPEIPQNLLNPKPKDPTDKQDKSLPSDKEKQLEKEQKDQSNQHK